MLRVGISAARLEHVARGVETWATDLADALREQDVDVVLFKGSGECRHPFERVLSSVKVGSRFSNVMCKVLPGCFWRIGLGSDEQLEETTFGISLARAVRREKIDILHMQDAHVANIIRRLQPFLFPKLKLILGHGTEESPEFLRKFECLQQLAPYHLAELLEYGRKEASAFDQLRRDRQKAQKGPRLAGGSLNHHVATQVAGEWTPKDQNARPLTVDQKRQDVEADSLEGLRSKVSSRWSVDCRHSHWVAIPNFVDTERFKPSDGGALRARLGIPEQARVVLSVAAIKRHHKRIDYLIDEVARVGRDDVWLVVAGAATPDTPELQKLAREQLGERVVFVTDLPHEEMHKVYNVGDLYTLTSLKDMMPIALLEALASGLPCIVSEYPVQQWMIGAAGGDFEPRMNTNEHEWEHSASGDCCVNDRGEYPSAISATVCPDGEGEMEDGSCGARDKDQRTETRGQKSEELISDLRPQTSGSVAAGESVDMSRAGALAEAIERHFADPELMSRRAEGARRQAEKMFSKDVVIGQYIEYYQRVLSTPPAPDKGGRAGPPAPEDS